MSESFSQPLCDFVAGANVPPSPSLNGYESSARLIFEIACNIWQFWKKHVVRVSAVDLAGGARVFRAGLFATMDAKKKNEEAGQVAKPCEEPQQQPQLAMRLVAVGKPVDNVEEAIVSLRRTVQEAMVAMLAGELTVEDIKKRILGCG